MLISFFPLSAQRSEVAERLPAVFCEFIRNYNHKHMEDVFPYFSKELFEGTIHNAITQRYWYIDKCFKKGLRLEDIGEEGEKKKGEKGVNRTKANPKPKPKPKSKKKKRTAGAASDEPSPKKK